MEPVTSSSLIKTQSNLSYDIYASALCDKVACVALNLFHSILASSLTYALVKYVLQASVLVTNSTTLLIGFITFAILNYLHSNEPFKPKDMYRSLPRRPIEFPKVSIKSDKEPEKQVEFVPTPQNQIVLPSPVKKDTDSNNSDSSGDTEPITPLSGSIYSILEQPKPIEVNMEPVKQETQAKEAIPIPKPPSPKKSFGFWGLLGYGTIWGNPK